MNNNNNVRTLCRNNTPEKIKQTNCGVFKDTFPNVGNLARIVLLYDKLQLLHWEFRINKNVIFYKRNQGSCVLCFIYNHMTMNIKLHHNIGPNLTNSVIIKV